MFSTVSGSEASKRSNSEKQPNINTPKITFAEHDNTVGKSMMSEFDRSEPTDEKATIEKTK